MGYRAISNHLIIRYIAKAGKPLKPFRPSFGAFKAHSKEAE